MSFLMWIGLLIAVVAFYSLSSRVGRLERELKAAKENSARALELATEVHNSPEYESELDKEIRRHKRDIAKLGIHPGQ